MLRRRHRKSRAGCSECRRRHIKCDENHPVCVNCTTASMRCSFTPAAQFMATAQIKDPSTVTLPEATSTASTPASSSTQPASMQGEPYVNALHMELFYSTIEGEWAFEGDKEAKPHVLRYAFIFPFLLNELLAVSALYLSIRRPAQQSLYRDEAARLQTEALRLFNKTIRDLNSESIIPIFLFSALFGIGTFFETFHDPTYESSEWTFFEKIVQSIRLLQSIRAIVDGWWHFLITSEIKGILKESPPPDLAWRDEVVDQFETFRIHILKSPGLDQAQIEVCEKAIEELISVYKVAFGSGCLLDDQVAIKHATQWLIIVPPAYTDLLVQRKPEALLILGHFAVILHKFRTCWTVGNSGQLLLRAIEAHLEELWHTKLLWPKSFIERH